ncbi:MAG TPA: 5-formyltetrahydrofolate cyclo-ligase, partial [bacterium]|nr:5-formyltetrahydrofolate cyclo-ligase [bacterium]
KYTKYKTNKYGILEPSDVLIENKEYKDIELRKKIIIICPGLAFDLSGNRLGRGAGYYDNFFESNNAERFYKIGVCFDFMLFDALPSNLRDVKMDCIIMSEKIINI